MFPFWVELSGDWLVQFIMLIVAGWSVLTLTHGPAPHA